MIETAVLLAAGEGSRLREAEPIKPLCLVADRPLIDHALAGLAEAGIGRAIVVTGYEAERIETYLAGRSWPLEVVSARTPDWREPNGVSALAAAPLLRGQAALLAMCDHLVDPLLYHRLAEAGEGDALRLGVDLNLGHDWIDADDVTCVRMRGGQIVAIGKGLKPHDGYDTGVFAVGARFFEALAALAQPSITDAVRRLASEGSAHAVDCSDLAWIDIDDVRALRLAEAWLSQTLHGGPRTATHGA